MYQHIVMAKKPNSEAIGNSIVVAVVVLRYVKTVNIYANMSSFAAEHRIKRPMHICILHRIVFTFVRYQIIVPCSKTNHLLCL